MKTTLFVNRSRISLNSLPVVRAVHNALAWLPYKFVQRPASARLERKYLQALSDTDIAYLWPAASLDVHRAVHARGIPIVLEGINTRMALAKTLLDRAYEDFGIAPAHGITEARIAEEEQKYTYASAIFAPNREVEAALANSPLEKSILPSSYGVDTGKALPTRSYRKKKNLTYIFCGHACIRKGVHFLLEAWKHMPAQHSLVLVGTIEPAISDRYAALLDSNNVTCVGFVRDVHPWFAKADVFIFPSLEEGGPQVTYEAALHGLPIIASPMGASRLGEINGTMEIVAPEDVDVLVETMLRLTDAEMRAGLGQTARSAVEEFDWMRVGAKRATQLHETFG